MTGSPVRQIPNSPTRFLGLCLVLLGSCGQEWGGGWPNQSNSNRSTGWGGLFGSSNQGKPDDWTIECNLFEGPDHRRAAERLGTALRRVPDLRADRVRVVHDEDRSLIYYGTYSLGQVERNGQPVVEFSADIKRDLRFIRSLSIDGRFPFFTARRIPVPLDDEGPIEWDLRQASGVYTLHVGVTYAEPPSLLDYKRAAVEWVQVLRDDGYEAYYFHHRDSPRSDVCVGTFGLNALVRERDNTVRYSNEVIQLQRKSDFKWNLENGRKISKRRADGSAMTNQSFLVEIPPKDGRRSARPPRPPQRSRFR